MAKQRIIILGGGISGLTLAYYLSKRNDLFDIDLIEKNSRLGGWVDSDSTTGFFFEKGPRVFRGSRCSAFLSLVHDIGMEKEMIESHRDGQAKYLWKDGKLRKLPMLSWGLVKGVVRDLRTPPLRVDDESVWDFACRRFNAKIAADFFDPLVVGIFGGGTREVSVRSCFPRLKKWEEEHGSVIRGAFKTPRFSGPRMFSFKRGLKSVIQRLEEVTPINFHQEERVVELKPRENGFEVVTSQKSYTADYVFSALPCHVIGKLFLPKLINIPMRGATIVNLGYDQNVLKKKGFGYLVASEEEDEVMGVIFDSVSFPQFNRGPRETRLTVKLRDEELSDGEARGVAIKALKKHLGITQLPTVSAVVRAEKVFPQMRVGHSKLIGTIEETLQQKHPRLRLVGNYLYGVGVNDCIERAKSVSENFLRDVAS